MLDELFEGRARLHAIAGDLLIPVGAARGVLQAPGPLHDVLDREDALLVEVDAGAFRRWDPSYFAGDLPLEGELLVVRIEGGGAVVGTLTVTRPPASRVAPAEERQLVEGLALRLGRTVAVPLALHAAAASVVGVPEAPDTPTPSRAAKTSKRAGKRAAQADQIIDLDQPDEIDETDLLARSIAHALRLSRDEVRLQVDPSAHAPGLQARAVIGAALGRLAGELTASLPPGGVVASVDQSDGRWVIELWPNDLEAGWQALPDLAARAQLRAVGAEAELRSNEDVGWVVAVITAVTEAAETAPPAELDLEPIDATAPAEDETASAGPTASGADLMGASLGDTTKLMVMVLDDEHRIVFCNQELASRLGVQIADLLGCRPDDVRASLGTWSVLDQQLARLRNLGVTQIESPWPHDIDSGFTVRWTVSASTNPGAGPVLVCLGLDAPIVLAPTG